MKLILFGILLLVAACIPPDSSTAASMDVNPPLEQLYSPFKEKGRNRFASIEKRTFSRFGAARKSPVSGHLHSGIDLGGKQGEKVYAIGPGRVVRHYWVFPNLAVAVKHRLPDGNEFYSTYVHVMDVRVKEGEMVDENSEIGRLFNKTEMGLSHFKQPHLHLEIRKSMGDDGNNSFRSMTRKSLEEYCLDPLPFLKRYMR